MAETGGATTADDVDSPDAGGTSTSAPDGEAAPGRGSRDGRALLRHLGRARVAWAVAVLAAVAAALFAVDAAGLRAREQARDEAREAGEIAALQLTTFTGETIDDWVERTQTLATGQFAQQITQQYDRRLREDLRAFQVESVGEVLNSFVQDIDGEEALVFVVLRQTTRYPTYDQTVEDEVRFEITLQRDGRRWLVSDARLLSPTPPLTPRPFLEQEPEEGTP